MGCGLEVMLLFVMLLFVMALDSFPITRRAPWGSLPVVDADRLHDPFRLRTGKVDRQQPVLQVRAQHLDTVGQHEATLKLPRRDAAVEIVARLLFLLAAADRQLIFLYRHVELIPRETRNCQRDAQTLRLAVLAGYPLDVVGRITVRGLRHTVEC